MANPTMKAWTHAWHEANEELFKDIYSENASVFPPNKPGIKGKEEIFQFLRGGLGKVDVVFEPESSFTDTMLAFEYGTFKDVELTGERKILGTGKYSVTWIFENSVWKILCHTWSLPVK